MAVANTRLEEQEGKPQSFLRLREGILLVAIQVVTVSYAAGLNPPGGVWADTKQDEHLTGNPILALTYHKRYTVFSSSNTTALMASSAVVLLLLFVRGDNSRRIWFNSVLRTVLSLGLIALAVAYIAGASRHKFTTAYASGIAGTPVPGYSRSMVNAVFVASITYTTGLNPPGGFWLDTQDGHRAGDPALMVHYRRRFTAFFVGNTIAFIASLFITPLLLTNNDRVDVDDDNPFKHFQRGQALHRLCAPWRVCPHTRGGPHKMVQKGPHTRGLNPPGGLWPDDLDGHNAGHPILLAKQPTRYRVFMYCNSMALVASLVATVMSLSQRCQARRSRALSVLLVLDLISLIGAYAAGCCRDVETSIHVIAMGGAIVVYVVFHMAFLMPSPDDKSPQPQGGGGGRQEQKGVEWNRDLMLGILGATLTYQTGLTPPGGFWPSDDEFGHHAGEPVLLSTYPNRYIVFFYLNALCFMSSIFLTVFFVNRYLYEAGIRCRALFICVLAVFFGLIGAYAAGSYRSLGQSISMIKLGVAVFILIVSILLLVYRFGKKGNLIDEEDEEGNNQQTETEPASSNNEIHEHHDVLEYLALIGSIGATVTYQAGFAPPRGFWPDDSDGHAVGDPVLRDMNGYLYRLYFFFNTTAFLASASIMNSGPMMFVMGKFMAMTTQTVKEKNQILYSALQLPTVLFAIGILGAYAAGSSSGWNNYIFAVALVAPVLFIIILTDCVSKLLVKMAKHLKVVSEE
ncbi:hypothetical protein HU200_044052 [Digitaria exilis]|uniref:PGG domain-containing protein n=1 Tax=Digitaria exilis TaxID=1010633 RepID=A0A835EEI7_9POAL|nr:hypothetical protein HU200_044052 [Digitaria exilis]